jgi:hypothetical protein
VAPVARPGHPVGYVDVKNPRKGFQLKKKKLKINLLKGINTKQEY